MSDNNIIGIIGRKRYAIDDDVSNKHAHKNRGSISRFKDELRHHLDPAVAGINIYKNGENNDDDDGDEGKDDNIQGFGACRRSSVQLGATDTDTVAAGSD